MQQTKPCDEKIADFKKAPDSWRPGGFEVKACYSEFPEEHSKLHFSRTICLIVTSINLLNGVLMVTVACGRAHTSERPILTVGDAVASYLEDADGYTTKTCLRSKKNFVKREWDPHPQEYDPIPRRKFNAGSLTRMVVLMSFIYFNYNALFTCLSLTTEWDRFYGSKKGIRVSTTPQGAQRQTYFLQLPYRYSIPLTVFCGGLHWLVSQSIFLVSIDSVGFASCGWSPIGIILVIVAGSHLLAFLVAPGYRRLRFGGIAVASSCSAAIAAACHPGPSEPDSAATLTLPLTWGVVSGKDDMPGHCSFTTRDVEEPVKGHLYE
ncbi:hypothetical protein CSOJ01_02895 [Colletotrichum sojae]|uniref:Uncharacterized protein n=1 Tax=Colletotrichum sojae TaxID=2175907 RepID=A0A8H6N1W2_9PEZI|nr:hypothetical protein CSOJ01_02895 [Colletotrichum sojae]